MNYCFRGGGGICHLVEQSKSLLCQVVCQSQVVHKVPGAFFHTGNKLVIIKLQYICNMEICKRK